MSCLLTAPYISCDMEQDGTLDSHCRLLQDPNGNFMWTQDAGRTPSGLISNRLVNAVLYPVTGPMSAKQGLYYIYIEASGQDQGSIARSVSISHDRRLWKQWSSSWSSRKCSDWLQRYGVINNQLQLVAKKMVIYISNDGMDQILNSSKSNLSECLRSAQKLACSLLLCKQSIKQSLPTLSFNDSVWLVPYKCVLIAWLTDWILLNRLILLDDVMSNTKCLRFFYCMNGFHTGILRVYRIVNDISRDFVWKMSGDRLPGWKMAAIDLNMTSVTEVIYINFNSLM